MSHEYCLTWDEFHRDTLALAHSLTRRGPWRGIIAIARGGLIPAGILSRELNIRMVDTVCIASYDHDQQGTLSVLKGLDHDGEGLLVVDDLVDTGSTGKLIKEILPKAHFVTVYAKPMGLTVADQYVREFPQDCWLHFPWDCRVQFAQPLANL